MNDIKIFENPAFGQVRTVVNERDKVLFCLLDLCKSLDLEPSAVKRRLDDGVTTNHPIYDNLGRVQQATFVNEDGFYDVVLDSRKPEAKKFRKWVTGEVLPSIRKDGGYMIAKDGESPEEVMARALVLAQETLARRDERIKALQAELTEKTLDSNYLSLVKKETSKGKFFISQIADDWGWSGTKMNKVLKQLGVIKKVGQHWQLRSKYISGNIELASPHPIWNNAHTKIVAYDLVWTMEGWQLIYNILTKNGYYPKYEQLKKQEHENN